jgi:predicted GNAT family acetyltransferase
MSDDSRLDELTVHDHTGERRYETRIGTKVVGVIPYQAEPRRLTLIHIEVDPAFEGKGVGSRHVAGALEGSRRRGVSVVPVCRLVRAYLRRHPEQADLLRRDEHATLAAGGARPRRVYWSQHVEHQLEVVESLAVASVASPLDSAS